MTTTVEQRFPWRALLLACCVSLGLAVHADAAHATAPDTAVLAPGTGYDGHQQAAVTRVQSRLLRLGYAPGPIDGLYGPLTTAAVRRLQSANGLGVDGLAGPRTRRALRVQARPEPQRVKRVQRRLRALGARPGPVDGIFGPRTVRALRQFRDAAGLTGPAKVDATTLARLEESGPRQPDDAQSIPATAREPAPAAPAPVLTPGAPTATPTPVPVVTPEPATATPSPTDPAASAPVLTPEPATATPSPTDPAAPAPVVTPDPATATPSPTDPAAVETPAPSVVTTGASVPAGQGTGLSGSLTLQIALIVGVMLLIALWPFRREDPRVTRRREEDERRDAERT